MLLVVLTSLVASCTAALRLVTSHGPAIHSVKSRRLLLLHGQQALLEQGRPVLRAGHRGHPDARARALTPLLRLPALRAPLPLVLDLAQRPDAAKYPSRKIVLELYVLGDAQGRRAHARRAHARANATAPRARTRRRCRCPRRPRARAPP